MAFKSHRYPLPTGSKKTILVKGIKRPFSKMNKGPGNLPLRRQYRFSAETGQNDKPVAARYTVAPTLNGSVFEDLIINLTPPLRLKTTSDIDKVTRGSHTLLPGAVYSETLNIPKKATAITAWYMVLS